MESAMKKITTLIQTILTFLGQLDPRTTITLMALGALTVTVLYGFYSFQHIVIILADKL